MSANLSIGREFAQRLVRAGLLRGPLVAPIADAPRRRHADRPEGPEIRHDLLPGGHNPGPAGECRGARSANVQKVPFWENLYSKAATTTLTRDAGGLQPLRGQPVRLDLCAVPARYRRRTRATAPARSRCRDLGPWAFYNPSSPIFRCSVPSRGGNYHGGQLNMRSGSTTAIPSNATIPSRSRWTCVRNTERAASSTGVHLESLAAGPDARACPTTTTPTCSTCSASTTCRSARASNSDQRCRPAPNAIVGGWQVSGAMAVVERFPDQRVRNRRVADQLEQQQLGVSGAASQSATAHR